MKHVVAAAIAALALVTAGCGSKTSGGNLDTALAYVPKNALAVVAIDTNPDGDQWQQVDRLLGKFPFGGQVKEQMKAVISARAKADFDYNIKPVLGNDLVLAVLRRRTATKPTSYIVAWKLGDDAAGRRLMQTTVGKSGTIRGLDLYGRPPGTTFAVIKDGTLVVADSVPVLTAALKRSGGSDHMTETEFNNALGELNKDSLLRGRANELAFRGQPGAPLRKVKWLNAGRGSAATIRADSGGIEYAFEAKTDAGTLTARDLPLAAGAESPPVVKRAGEIGFAIRNPAQLIDFIEQVTRVTSPAGYAKYVREKAWISKRLGADVDRDLFGQLTGDAAVSIDINGGVALRAGLRDSAAFRTTLKKFERLARRGGTTVPVSPPTKGRRFYALRIDGQKVLFGVVGGSFVLATDEARATQFAGQSGSTIPRAKGSLVIYSDARALANAIAARQGQGAAAQVFTSALGDLTGSIRTERSGITGSIKLQIK